MRPKRMIAFAGTRLLAAILPLGSAAGAHGTAGSPMGATAEASVRISVSVAPAVRVHGQGALEAAPDGAGSGERPFCVSASPGAGTFSVRALDPLAAASPEGVAPSRQFPYRIEWARATAAKGAAPLALAPGTSLAGLAPASRDRCGSAGRLVVRPAASSGPAPAPSALLLIIAPD